MAEGGLQRHYRAPCPSCGAPVEFQSAQSEFAVCGYCHSTVVRSGDVLRRIGNMAEVFDDFSPLRLMASGVVEGQAFTLIGRLQYKGEAGNWTEWIAMLPDGSTGTLSEDNGRYVFTRPWTPAGPLPPLGDCTLGRALTVGDRALAVAARGQVRLIAAEGELPKLPALGEPFDLVELRSADGEVVSIDYGSQPPHLERGGTVELAALQLKGLKDESASDGAARQFNCPHCGAPVAVKLESTKSLTCGTCQSLIDISSGIGGELKAVQQGKPSAPPLIALGSIGQFEGAPWQVVGFQHRMGREPDDDETFGWDEYLLFHQQKGFCFLVDASDGWSLVRPTTGAPGVLAGGAKARYLGTTYLRTSSYNAETTHVLGEFYWPVTRGQRTDNVDYAGERGGILSQERSGSEITWSVGNRLASAAVAQAFGRAREADQFKRDEVGPFVAAKGAGCAIVLVALFILFIIFVVFAAIIDDSSSSSGYSRSSGGSFGGYSSGGSHK